MTRRRSSSPRMMSSVPRRPSCERKRHRRREGGARSARHFMPTAARTSPAPFPPRTTLVTLTRWTESYRDDRVRTRTVWAPLRSRGSSSERIWGGMRGRTALTRLSSSSWIACWTVIGFERAMVGGELVKKGKGEEGRCCEADEDGRTKREGGKRVSLGPMNERTDQLHWPDG